MSDAYHDNKAAVRILSKSLYDFDAGSVRAALDRLVSRTAVCHFFHPLGDIPGDQIFEQVFAPLAGALPDVERRDLICIAGADEDTQNWVGCAGHYVGRFMAPFMNIPPTGHAVHIRFHEFYRFADGRIVEIQAIWDLPGLMMQAGVWPMGPSLGREWFVPGPASQDGLYSDHFDERLSVASRDHVKDMLNAMQRFPSQGGPEVMDLETYWHPHFSWYGPSGIGTTRGIDGFRRWHQTPFLKAMPDRGQYSDAVVPHFFAENLYVAVTGWPTMAQTLTSGGWLGIAPADRKITLCSLDFWRLENDRIRENWVLVDLLDVWAQLGVDVMERMNELAGATSLSSVQTRQEACG